jgi:hypothetical protein
MLPFNGGEYRFTLEQWHALGTIADEMQRHGLKWPNNSHDPNAWNTILTEEVGEAAKEAFDLCVRPASEPGSIGNKRTRQRYREELSHVAAVAAAAIADELDRNGGV